MKPIRYFIILPFLRGLLLPWSEKTGPSTVIPATSSSNAPFSNRVAQNPVNSMFIADQNGLNKLFFGHRFDLALPSAELLSLVFIAMTFAPGIPLITIVCTVALGLLFFTKKFLLLRYYRRPIKVGPKSMHKIMTILPFAVIIRLAFGCWMYSSPTLLRQIYPQEDIAGWEQRTNLPNTEPMFIVLIIYIIFELVYQWWWYLPLGILIRLLKGIYKCFCGITTKSLSPFIRNKDDKIHEWTLVKLRDPIRSETSAYTGPYFKYWKRNSETKSSLISRAWTKREENHKLHPIEKEIGWVVVTDGDFTGTIVKWKETHRRSDGTFAYIGDRKRTYEIIGSGLNSYHIERIPRYSLAVDEIRRLIINEIMVKKDDTLSFEDYKRQMAESLELQQHDIMSMIKERVNLEATLLRSYLENITASSQKSDAVFVGTTETDSDSRINGGDFENSASSKKFQVEVEVTTASESELGMNSNPT